MTAPPPADTLCDHCNAALAALEHVLAERPDKIHGEIVEAVVCLVRLRNGLIERRRAGDTSPELADRLDRANAIMSVVVGGEYPLVGVRWGRIQQARDALKKLLDEVT